MTYCVLQIMGQPNQKNNFSKCKVKLPNDLYMFLFCRDQPYHTPQSVQPHLSLVEKVFKLQVAVRNLMRVEICNLNGENGFFPKQNDTIFLFRVRLSQPSMIESVKFTILSPRLPNQFIVKDGAYSHSNFYGMQIYGKCAIHGMV